MCNITVLHCLLNLDQIMQDLQPSLLEENFDPRYWSKSLALWKVRKVIMFLTHCWYGFSHILWSFPNCIASIDNFKQIQLAFLFT